MNKFFMAKYVTCVNGKGYSEDEFYEGGIYQILSQSFRGLVLMNNLEEPQFVHAVYAENDFEPISHAAELATCWNGAYAQVPSGV